MKFKFISIIALAITLIIPGQAQAKQFMTGEAQGETIIVDFEPAGLADEFRASIYEYSDNNTTLPSTVCDTLGCLMTGFAWSELVGWIVLDGYTLQQVTPGYLNSDYPKVLYKYNGAGRYPLTGFVWAEHGGWIALSDDTGSPTPVGTTTDTTSQDNSDWGVWAEITDLGGGTIDVQLRGFAWGEDVGWIKMSSEAGDSPTFQSESDWDPDLESPEIFAVDGAWFENTSSGYVMNWEYFADDGVAGILNTNLSVTTPNPECVPPGILGEEVITGSSAIRLIMPLVGFVQWTNVANKGYCEFEIEGTITDAAGLRTYIGDGTGARPEDTVIADPITMYTMAGTPATIGSSDLTLPTPAVADGTHLATFDLNVDDLGTNNVISIPADVVGGDSPGRDVNVVVDINNTVYYDSVLSTNSGSSTPIVAGDSSTGFPLNEGITQIDYSGAIPLTFDLATETYPLTLSSYAPTVGSMGLDSFVVDQYTVSITDEALGDESTHPDYVAGPERAALTTNYPAFAVNEAVVFTPGVTVGNGSISSETITPGIPYDIDFEVENNSTSKIISSLAVNNDLVYKGGSGSGVFYMAASDIHETSSADAARGRLNPVGITSSYELYEGEFFSGTDFSATNSIFDGLHTPYADWELNIAGVAADGAYNVDESFNATDDRIDRSEEDSFSSGIAITTDPANPEFVSKQISFIPAHNPPGPLENVTFEAEQQIGYRYNDQQIVTVYEPSADLFPPATVQAIGAQFTGTASGEQIFETDKEFDVIGGGATVQLQDQIRKNLGALTVGQSPCTAADNFVITSNQLPTNGNCVVNLGNNQYLAYYEGTPDEITISLDNSGSDIIVPNDARYTIAIRGGGNLEIKDNLVYGNANASLGFILLKNDDPAYNDPGNIVSDTDRGANIFISAEPTNIIGNVYAEGALISYDSVASSFYYGTNAISSTDLKHQLYWQGSIASSNTIGGASRTQLPEGKGCDDGSTNLACAQRFDLDFLRRFAVVNNVTTDPSVRYSGGGTCNPTCTPGPLPSSITESGGTIDVNNSDIDAFFIEKDAKLDNNPPPGFALSSGTSTSQEIR